MRYMIIVVVLGFGILCFNLQGGLERITKYMMVALLALMLILAGNSITLSGAAEGLKFYLLPDFSKITPSVVVGAMNQAFFTLSLGIGSMAIFGSYIGKDRALLGESVNIILLDTFVAITAGLIIFPACFTYNIEVNAGPSLLFDTMATVFNNMAGGRLWGTLFFLFMVFAAFSTELAVFSLPLLVAVSTVRPSFSAAAMGQTKIFALFRNVSVPPSTFSAALSSFSLSRSAVGFMVGNPFSTTDSV